MHDEPASCRSALRCNNALDAKLNGYSTFGRSPENQNFRGREAAVESHPDSCLGEGIATRSSDGAESPAHLQKQAAFPGRNTAATKYWLRLSLKVRKQTIGK